MDIKKQRLISDCVEALHKLNKEQGFSAISKQTLNIIMASYAEKYDSPNFPGSNVSRINVLAKYLNDVQQTNKDKEARLQRERLENNKKVLKAYRIKR